MSEISKAMMKKAQFIGDVLEIHLPPTNSYSQMYNFIQKYYDEAVTTLSEKEEIYNSVYD